MNPVLSFIDELLSRQDERNSVVFEMAECIRNQEPEQDRIAGKEVS